MKILLVRSSSGYVDVRNAHYNIQETGLARAFNRKGHQCDVVFWGGKKEEVIEIEYDGGKTFKVFYLKAYDILKNGVYKGLKELSKNYDIVHCGGYDQINSWILAKSIPEKLVVYNGSYYSDFNTGYNKKCKVVDKLFLPRFKRKGIFFDTKSNLSADFLRQRGLTNVYPVGVGIDLERLKSKELERVFGIILDGRKSGSSISKVLSDVSDDLRDLMALKRERKSSVMMSVMFLLISAVIATPFSIGMVSVYSGFMQSYGMESEIILTAPIAGELYLIIHSILVAFIISIIMYGDIKKGIKFSLPLAVSSFGIFYFISTFGGSLLMGGL